MNEENIQPGGNVKRRKGLNENPIIAPVLPECPRANKEIVNGLNIRGVKSTGYKSTRHNLLTNIVSKHISIKNLIRNNMKLTNNIVTKYINRPNCSYTYPYTNIGVGTYKQANLSGNRLINYNLRSHHSRHVCNDNFDQLILKINNILQNQTNNHVLKYTKILNLIKRCIISRYGDVIRHGTFSNTIVDINDYITNNPPNIVNNDNLRSSISHYGTIYSLIKLYKILEYCNNTNINTDVIKIKYIDTIYNQLKFKGVTYNKLFLNDLEIRNGYYNDNDVRLGQIDNAFYSPRNYILYCIARHPNGRLEFVDRNNYGELSNRYYYNNELRQVICINNDRRIENTIYVRRDRSHYNPNTDTYYSLNSRIYIDINHRQYILDYVPENIRYIAPNYFSNNIGSNQYVRCNRFGYPVRGAVDGARVNDDFHDNGNTIKYKLYNNMGNVYPLRHVDKFRFIKSVFDIYYAGKIFEVVFNEQPNGTNTFSIDTNNNLFNDIKKTRILQNHYTPPNFTDPNFATADPKYSSNNGLVSVNGINIHRRIINPNPNPNYYFNSIDFILIQNPNLNVFYKEYSKNRIANKLVYDRNTCMVENISDYTHNYVAKEIPITPDNHISHYLNIIPNDIDLLNNNILNSDNVLSYILTDKHYGNNRYIYTYLNNATLDSIAQLPGLLFRAENTINPINPMNRFVDISDAIINPFIVPPVVVPPVVVPPVDPGVPLVEGGSGGKSGSKNPKSTKSKSMKSTSTKSKSMKSKSTKSKSTKSKSTKSKSTKSKSIKSKSTKSKSTKSKSTKSKSTKSKSTKSKSTKSKSTKSKSTK